MCGPPQSLRAGFQCGRGLRPLPPLGPSQQCRVGSCISQGRASYAAVTNDPQSQQLKKAKADFWLTQRVCHTPARAGQPPCPTRRGRPGTRPDGRRLVLRPFTFLLAGLCRRRCRGPATPHSVVSAQGPLSSTEAGTGLGGRGASPPTPPRCSMTKGTAQGEEPAAWPRLSDTQGK